MEVNIILELLKEAGSEQTKKVLLNHGIPEPLYGVKIENMKQLMKQTGKSQDMAYALYDSGIYDAMYMAGLMADPKKFTIEKLNEWAAQSNCASISEYTVAWMAAESPFGWQIGLQWIESDNDRIKSSGWAALLNVLALKQDTDLDLEQIKVLMQRVQNSIRQQSDRVAYAMNNFIISVGSYVKPLHEQAIQIAENIGEVTIDMGKTSCKVPYAVTYIEKVAARGSIGKKKKTVVC